MLQTNSSSNAAGTSATAPTSAIDFDISNIVNVVGQLTNLVNTNIGFGSAEALVKNFNEMEKTVINLSMRFGGNREFANEIKQSLHGAAMSVMELGGNMSDVINIQKGVVDGLGTQTILTKESYQDMYAAITVANDGMDITKESVSTIVKDFSNAGIQLKNIGGEITKVMNTAKQIGLDATKVFDEIEKNISKLQLFNFQNGVEGMAKMAAHAVNMKINMNDTLNFADKLFNPEKAIEMSATFQRLGVNVSNLLDPYKLMDMARNDPEELQRSLGEAMSQLTYFDEKQKRMVILPEAQGLIRTMRDDLGLSTEYMVNLATNTSTMNKKMSEIKFPDFAKDEKTQTFIANMATMAAEGTKNAGKWVVNIAGEEVLVDQMSSTQREILQAQADKAGKPAQDAVELQREANGTLVNMYNQLVSLNEELPRALAAAPQTTKILEALAKRGEKAIITGKESLGIERKQLKPGSKFTDPSQFESNVGNFMGQSFNEIIEGFQRGESIPEILGRVAEKFDQNFSKMSTLKEKILNDMRQGDIMAEMGLRPGTTAPLSTLPSPSPALINNTSSTIPTSAAAAATATATPIAPVSSLPTAASILSTTPNTVTVKWDPNTVIPPIKIDAPGLERYLTEDKLNSRPIMDKVTKTIQDILLEQTRLQ